MKNIRAIFFICVIFVLPGVDAWGAEKYVEVEAGLGYETLTDNYDPWSEAYINIKKNFDKRKSVSINVRKTERFGLEDNELSVGIVTSWWAPITLSLMAGESQGHEVLPENFLSFRIDAPFGDGWVGGMGYTYREYESAGVDIGTVALERYIANFRLSYALFMSRVDEADLEYSNSIRMDRYYGDKNMVGIGCAWGRESENIASEIIVTSSVSSAILTGRHWFDMKRGMSYTLSYQRQGDFYDRFGIHAALIYRF